MTKDELKTLTLNQRVKKKLKQDRSNIDNESYNN